MPAAIILHKHVTSLLTFALACISHLHIHFQILMVTFKHFTTTKPMRASVHLATGFSFKNKTKTPQT